VSRAAPLGHYLLNQFGFGGNNAVLVLEKPA
jgi:3-oxoacyl-(acyl-carrier-protein) synthase